MWAYHVSKVLQVHGLDSSLSSIPKDANLRWGLRTPYPAYPFSPPFKPNPLLNRPRTGLLEHFNETILPIKLLF